MQTDRLLIVACFICFTAGFLVGTFPHTQITTPLPANYDPVHSDLAATIKAQQDSISRCFAALGKGADGASH